MTGVLIPLHEPCLPSAASDKSRNKSAFRTLNTGEYIQRASQTHVTKKIYDIENSQKMEASKNLSGLGYSAILLQF
jgi:hypothetical protein